MLSHSATWLYCGGEYCLTNGAVPPCQSKIGSGLFIIAFAIICSVLGAVGVGAQFALVTEKDEKLLDEDFNEPIDEHTDSPHAEPPVVHPVRRQEQEQENETDWTYDPKSTWYYSAKLDLYYDPKREQFFDEKTKMWKALPIERPNLSKTPQR